MKDFFIKRRKRPMLDGGRNILDELLWEGVRRILQSAIEKERFNRH